jgi:hypothetical protein
MIVCCCLLQLGEVDLIILAWDWLCGELFRRLTNLFVSIMGRERFYEVGGADSVSSMTMRHRLELNARFLLWRVLYPEM